MSERVCTNCAYCIHSGTGYSEWTIMGEDLICSRGLRPDIDTEIAKDEDIALMNSVAATCPAFVEGIGPRLGLYSDDEDKDWADWAQQTGLAIPEGYGPSPSERGSEP